KARLQFLERLAERCRELQLKRVKVIASQRPLCCPAIVHLQSQRNDPRPPLLREATRPAKLCTYLTTKARPDTFTLGSSVGKHAESCTFDARHYFRLVRKDFRPASSNPKLAKRPIGEGRPEV